MAAQISDFTYTPLKFYKLLNKKSQKKQAVNQINQDMGLAEIITNKQKRDVNINKNRVLCIISDRTRSYNSIIRYVSSTYRLMSQKHNLDLNVVFQGQEQKKTMLIDVTINVNYLVVSCDNFIIKSSNNSKVDNLVVLCDEFDVKCGVFMNVISLKLFGKVQKTNPYDVNLYLTKGANIFELMSVFGKINVNIGKSGTLLLTCFIDFDLKIVGDVDIFHFISRSCTLVKYLETHDDFAFDIYYYEYDELFDMFNQCLENPASNNKCYTFLIILSQQLYALNRLKDNEINEAKYLLNLMNSYDDFIIMYFTILKSVENKRLIYNALRKIYLPYNKNHPGKKLIPLYLKLVKKSLGICGKCRQFL